MPRTNRHFLPRHVWHITHRCHHKAMHREVEQADGTDALRESSEAYGSESVQEDEALTPENTIS